jgi:hypothetical protein
MGILYIYRHGNLAHPPAGAIVDGLGPRIGPGLMIAAGGGPRRGRLGGEHADEGLVLLSVGAAFV